MISTRLFRGVELNEINQAGTGYVITARSRGKLKILYSTTRVPLATKLGRFTTCLMGFWNPYISATTVPMATKLCRIGTHLEGLLPIMLLDPLVMWFYEITWQTKANISLLPRWLWPPNLARVWFTSNYKVIWPIDHVVFWDHVTN